MDLRLTGRVKARRKEMDYWPLRTLNLCSLRLSEERNDFISPLTSRLQLVSPSPLKLKLSVLHSQPNR